MTQCNYENQLIALRENNLDNPLLLASKFINTLDVTEPVSKYTSDTPHTNNGEGIPPIFSQTQTGINNSYSDYDDEDSPITSSSG